MSPATSVFIFVIKVIAFILTWWPLLLIAAYFAVRAILKRINAAEARSEKRGRIAQYEAAWREKYPQLAAAGQKPPPLRDEYGAIVRE